MEPSRLSAVRLSQCFATFNLLGASGQRRRAGTTTGRSACRPATRGGYDEGPAAESEPSPEEAQRGRRGERTARRNLAKRDPWRGTDPCKARYAASNPFAKPNANRMATRVPSEPPGSHALAYPEQAARPATEARPLKQREAIESSARFPKLGIARPALARWQALLSLLGTAAPPLFRRSRPNRLMPSHSQDESVTNLIISHDILPNHEQTPPMKRNGAASSPA